MNKQLLKRKGWTVECQSPFEIRHEDGSFATGQAADMIYNIYKSEQDRDFRFLEVLIGKHRTKFILEPEREGVLKAVRTMDGTYNMRTHNLKLNKATGFLYWENNNSREFGYQFETTEAACEWWSKNITPKVGKF